MRKNTLLLLTSVLFAMQGVSQKVTHVTSKQEGNKIIVSYKVEGGATDKVYAPTLYYSTNGGANFSKCKSTKAKPNQTAQITWKVTRDLDYFEGS